MTRSDHEPPTPPVVDAAAVEALAKQVKGPVHVPGDEQYDAERAGHQTTRWHRPDVVVGALGPADVRAALAFATEQGLPVAVQGTGHALSAVAAQGGVLITTSRMTGVWVNAEAGTAWVGAGMTWERVIDEAAAAGLAPLSGSAPGVGAVSYTLGGGIGLLSRRYGFAADHVRSLDVVTADGTLRNVTETSNPDLFWALRGGRDNFGIVTGIEIDLMPITALYGGGLFFDIGSAAEVLTAYANWTTTVPDELTSSIALISFPDVPVLPPPLRGRYVVHVRVAYAADNLSAGEGLVAPLRALNPFIDTVAEIPYTQAGTIHNDPPFPGTFESGTALLGTFDADVVTALLEHVGPHALVPHVVEVRHLGGRLSQPPAVANAVGHRDAQYAVNVVSRLERAEIGDVRPAHERVFAALAPWATGGRTLTFLNGENDAKDVASAYDAKDYQRLTEIKAVYDPANLFRLNHNIPPAS
ncbi:FAD-binding oxidoreductase [Actinokineospora cianjurensis]|uniref:FAD/FMN-containing dehydrogenase n=1 Tax=Actinokineospora cianjurensis TaxID=585224 RepID=A0A421B3I7_9PSEU|nr:FAD-binding oxidoreductase [Actinokineospora cianjurensis]RLK58843.1 FAD/FMN-containing dehydrogenase [Actinokineospora cianjurensis]